MQLSLRTLLAFADDIYDPQSRQQVIQHIKEHPTAATALQKIHDVVHSETVAVPGNELEPNLVAAYLDHLLSDEEVYRFEILACQSQVYLAEVASIHRLLNVVLGRPATISSDIRQRLYRIPVLKSLASSTELQVRQNQPSCDIQIQNRHERFPDRQRPQLSELLSSCQRKKQTRLWGISLFCVVLFIAVFFLNVFLEPPQSASPPSRPTAVPVATLAPKVGNSDYFLENRDLMDFPPPAFASVPVYPIPVSGSSMPVVSDMNEFSPPENLVASVPAVPSLSHDPVLMAQNPLTTNPYPEVQSAYSPISTGHSGIYAPTDYEPISSVEGQNLPFFETQPGNYAYDVPQEASHHAEMEIRYDSNAATFHQPGSYPNVIFPGREAQHGSLMQISSVSHNPPHQLIQQSNISFDEIPSTSASRIDVKSIGNAPSIRDIIDRPLPPLVPNHEKMKFQENVLEPDLSLNDENTNQTIAPVSFQKQNTVFSERMKITTLRLSENDLAFVAKDKKADWERAIDARSLSGDFLLVPAPFSATVHAGNGVKLTVTGDTQLNVLTDSAGIDFKYGHIRIEVDQDAIFPVSYTIKTPNGDGTLTFFSPKTQVHLTSLCRESQSYAPQLLVFPKDGDSAIWTPGKTQLQLKIEANFKILLDATIDRNVVPLEKGFDENTIETTSDLMSENLKKTGQKLRARVVSSATLESILEEMLADPSEDVVILGCRWCAELGLMDIPFTFLTMDHLAPTIHKQLNDYLSEVKLRDPETVSRMELAEKIVNDP